MSILITSRTFVTIAVVTVIFIFTISVNMLWAQPSQDELQIQIDQTSSQIKELNNQIKELSSDVTQTTAQRVSLEARVSELETTRSKLLKDVELAEAKINNTELVIEQIDQNLFELQSEINLNKTVIQRGIQ